MAEQIIAPPCFVFHITIFFDVPLAKFNCRP